MNMTAEDLFCVKHLYEQGVTSKTFDSLVELLDRFDVSDYTITKVGKESFYEDLAKNLRELWPPGEKDGKYPWRDSVKNISFRLKALWEDRKLSDFTIDDCLMVARRYLARFEQDTKYMMLLKYFIWKQKKLVNPTTGKITYVYDSMLADMLEGKSDIDAIENEWEQLIQDASIGEGRLIV